MKSPLRILVVSCALISAGTCVAYGESTVPLGFSTHRIDPGYVYFAPSLADPAPDAAGNYIGHRLETLFEPELLPDGLQVELWDAEHLDWRAPSVFRAADREWSIDYRIEFGTGVRIYSPEAEPFEVEVRGAVHPDTFDGVDVFPYHRDTPDGFRLLGSGNPAGVRNFVEIFGRAPENGEAMIFEGIDYTFDAASGLWTGEGYASSNSPALAPGQAAFFNLGPIPEPSVSLLLVGSNFLLLRRRRWSRPSARRALSS